MNNFTQFSLRKFIGFVIAVVAIFAVSITAIANDTVRDLQERRQNVQDSVREQRELLAEAQAERNDMLAEIVLMDIELTELSYAYVQAREELEDARALLAFSEESLERAEERREAQMETLRNRIRFMHENNSITYIELLFTSDSINDFLSNIEHISRIIEHDNTILDSMKETEARIAAHTAAVAVHHNDVELLNFELENRIEELEINLATRERRINELEADEEHYRAMAALFEEEAREIQLAILNAEALAEAARQARMVATSNQRSVSVASDAIFQWPVDGPRGVNSGYGWRQRPFGGGSEFHEGVDLRATMNTPILAAADGIVTQSQYRRGYGNTVVISHGGGLSTLYAHNSRNIVEVGEEVMRGQIIAMAGSTGLSTGPHLHFEVWINGSHTDPGPYLGLN